MKDESSSEEETSVERRARIQKYREEKEARELEEAKKVVEQGPHETMDKGSIQSTPKQMEILTPIKIDEPEEV